MDEESLIFDHKKRYCRGRSEATDKLGRVLLEKYQRPTHNAVISPSGLCAITTAIRGLFSYDPTKSLIVCDWEMYCDTLPALYDIFSEMNGSAGNFVIRDLCDPESLQKPFCEDEQSISRVIVFAETFTNPTGRKFAFNAVNDARERLGDKLIFILDDTWSSGVLLNPFDWDIDVIVLSTTKYVSGNKAMGGAILGTPTIMEPIMYHHNSTGIHASPMETEIITKASVDWPERYKSAALVASVIIQNLKATNWKSLTLKYAENSPIFVVMTNYSGKQTKKAFRKLISRKEIELKTSYGGAYERIDPYPMFSDDKVSFRVSIGYNSDADQVTRRLLEIITELNCVDDPKTA